MTRSHARQSTQRDLLRRNDEARYAFIAPDANVYIQTGILNRAKIPRAGSPSILSNAHRRKNDIRFVLLDRHVGRFRLGLLVCRVMQTAPTRQIALRHHRAGTRPVTFVVNQHHVEKLLAFVGASKRGNPTKAPKRVTKKAPRTFRAAGLAVSSLNHKPYGQRSSICIMANQSTRDRRTVACFTWASLWWTFDKIRTPRSVL